MNDDGRPSAGLNLGDKRPDLEVGLGVHMQPDSELFQSPDSIDPKVSYDRHARFPQYGGAGEWVPLSTYGLTHRVESGARLVLTEHEIHWVPLTSCWSQQQRVYSAHVEKLAGLSKDTFKGASSVHVVAWPDETFAVIEGNHRACAALARGDHHLEVLVVMRAIPRSSAQG